MHECICSSPRVTPYNTLGSQVKVFKYKVHTSVMNSNQGPEGKTIFSFSPLYNIWSFLIQSSHLGKYCLSLLANDSKFTGTAQHLRTLLAGDTGDGLWGLWYARLVFYNCSVTFPFGWCPYRPFPKGSSSFITESYFQMETSQVNSSACYSGAITDVDPNATEASHSHTLEYPHGCYRTLELGTTHGTWWRGLV